MNLALTNKYKLAVSSSVTSFLLTIRDSGEGIASPAEMAVTSADSVEPSAADFGHIISPSEGTRREVAGSIWLRVLPGHNPSGTIS